VYYNGKLIRLRPSEAEDIPLFVHWLSNPELRDYVTIRYISEALERRWFEGLVAATSGVAPQRLHFVIEAWRSKRLDDLHCAKEVRYAGPNKCSRRPDAAVE